MVHEKEFRELTFESDYIEVIDEYVDTWHGYGTLYCPECESEIELEPDDRERDFIVVCETCGCVLEYNLDDLKEEMEVE